MSTIVFQVSRYKAAKQQLRLKEKYNSLREQVTAMATLHMAGEEPWLSGMHYCYIDNQGDKFFSFNKEEGVEFKVDFNINMMASHLTTLHSQLALLGDRIQKPANDDNGVSQLRGIQLHVILHEDAEFSLNMKEDAKFGDRLQKKVQSHSVKEVKIVTASDCAYVQAPDTQTLSADLSIQALYTKSEKEEIRKPANKDEAKLAILSVMSSRKANRQEAHRKQAARGGAAVRPTSEPSKKISLVDEDDQPE